MFVYSIKLLFLPLLLLLILLLNNLFGLFLNDFIRFPSVQIVNKFQINEIFVLNISFFIVHFTIQNIPDHPVLQKPFSKLFKNRVKSLSFRVFLTHVHVFLQCSEASNFLDFEFEIDANLVIQLIIISTQLEHLVFIICVNELSDDLSGDVPAQIFIVILYFLVILLFLYSFLYLIRENLLLFLYLRIYFFAAIFL